MDKQKIVIIVLAVALFLFAQYYVIEKWLVTKEQELALTYQNGYERGLSDAAKEIFASTKDCKPAIITLNDTTKQFFDASCLKSSNGSYQP